MPTLAVVRFADTSVIPEYLQEEDAPCCSVPLLLGSESLDFSFCRDRWSSTRSLEQFGFGRLHLRAEINRFEQIVQEPFWRNHGIGGHRNTSPKARSQPVRRIHLVEFPHNWDVVFPSSPSFRDNTRMVGKRYRLKWSMTAFAPKPTAAESDIRLPVNTTLTVTGVRDENDFDAVTSDGKRSGPAGA